MSERVVIDFYDVCREATDRGMLALLLRMIPQTKWMWRGGYLDDTLLHIVCRGNDVAALVMLLQSRVVDLNARNCVGGTCVISAAANDNPRMLEVLCAAGADLRSQDECGHTGMVYALLVSARNGGKTARVLLANGIRMNTVREYFRTQLGSPELEAFERGVLRYRAAVAALLRIGQPQEIALAVWATRYGEKWQN